MRMIWQNGCNFISMKGVKVPMENTSYLIGFSTRFIFRISILGERGTNLGILSPVLAFTTVWDGVPYLIEVSHFPIMHMFVGIARMFSRTTLFQYLASFDSSEIMVI